MLCAPESSMCAQPRTHDHADPSITEISLIHDPYDPRIESEYEILVKRWNQQLLQRSQEFISSLEKPGYDIDNDPKAPLLVAEESKDCREWTADMDRFFEELWLDAQHMLQCAQAWNYASSLSLPSASTDVLSIKDAVRSMNIFGLRVLQRSLYGRQIFLKAHYRQQTPVACASGSAATSPQLTHSKTSPEKTGTYRGIHEMPEEQVKAEKINARNEPHTSLPPSPVEDDDDHDDHRMNAPLLRRTYHQSLAKSSSITSNNRYCDDKGRLSANDAPQEPMTTSSWVGLLPYPPVRRSTSCLPTTTTTTTTTTAAAAAAAAAATAATAATATATATATNGEEGSSPATTRRQRLQNASSTATMVTPRQRPVRSASTHGPTSSSQRQYPRQRNDVLSMTSSSGMSNIDEDGLWKSWFGNNDDVGSNNGHPLCNRTTSDVTSSRDYGSSNTHTPQSVCDETEDITAAYQHGLSDGDDPENMSNFHGATMIAPSLPMDEKAQIDSPIEEARLHRLHHSSSGDNTDDTTVIAPPLPSSLKMVRGYGFTKPMVRSESSISAFRPSSKNFAPRCPRDGTPEPSSSLEPGIQPISKSRSFPSRVTFASSSPTDESSPLSALSPSRSKPLPRINDNNQGAKERNSVMRSIVGKKTSLGKLFSAKK